MSGFERLATADPTRGSGDPPAPGEYMVSIQSGRAFTSQAGDDYAAITVRDLRQGHEWDVLYGFASDPAADFAAGELLKLGIEYKTLPSLDALDDALKDCQGHYFDVKVVAPKKEGYKASTYIVGQALPDGVPESDFAPVAAGDQGVPEDDSIPF